MSPAPHDTTHLPALQMYPGSQIFPHAPQFDRSLSRSAQYGAPPGAASASGPASPPPVELLHVLSGGAHVSEHVPPLHTCPALQALPHLPQFALSVVRSTHNPLHAVSVAGHAS
jgi:hypothetical protein